MRAGRPGSWSREVHRLVAASSRCAAAAPVGSPAHTGDQLSLPRAPRGPTGGPDRAVWARRPCRVGKDDLLGTVCCPDLPCTGSHAVAHADVAHTGATGVRRGAYGA